MLEAQYTQAATFKKVIDALKDLVTDVTFEAGPDGLYMQAMDASHVALISLTLTREGFFVYNCERPVAIGVSMSNLSKIIKCAENDDSIIFRVDQEATYLNLIFEGKKDDKVSEFHLNLLTMDSEHLEIPEEAYPATITLPTAELASICRELSQMNDTIALDIANKRVTFRVDGDIGKGSITLKDGTSSRANISADQEVSVSYAVRYLNLFCKSATVAPSASLSVGEAQPMIMQLAFELGVLKYYLAPKVDD